jgi:hypothetical protein
MNEVDRESRPGARHDVQNHVILVPGTWSSPQNDKTPLICAQPFIIRMLQQMRSASTMAHGSLPQRWLMLPQDKQLLLSNSTWNLNRSFKAAQQNPQEGY